MKFMERNYDFMKGTEVDCVEFDGSITKCFVAHADPKHGITIVHVDDPNKEHSCLNYDIQQSPDWDTGENYIGAFAHIIAKCKRGKLMYGSADKVWRKDKNWDISFSQRMNCAFK